MEDREYNCPLLNREIDEGYCYDIYSVALKVIKPETLDDEVDRDLAYSTCLKCEHKPY